MPRSDGSAFTPFAANVMAILIVGFVIPLVILSESRICDSISEYRWWFQRLIRRDCWRLLDVSNQSGSGSINVQ